MRIFDMRVNQLETPLGFKMEHPRFRFKVDGAEGKFADSARVKLALDPEMREIVWDSGDVKNPDLLDVEAFVELAPRTRYYWSASVVTDAGETAEGVSVFETGKRDEPWQARWIASDAPGNKIFKKRFCAKKPVASARCYMTGMGVFELYVNGQKAGDELLAPFCNAYDKWIQVLTYDVTDLLAGENEISVMTGDGWALGRFALRGRDHICGSEQAILAELHILYQDGTEENVVTDESWIATESPVLFSAIYDGEIYDAGKNVSKEYPVRVTEEYGFDRLTDRLSVPVRVTERIRPAKIFRSVKNELILDLGQEITGYLEMKLHVPAGQKVKLSYFELLQDGAYYRDNLRSAKEEYEYVSDGAPAVVRPYFTFYGFRYVMIEGLDNPALDDFAGCVVHSDIPAVGLLRTSNAKLNRFIENAFWGQRGNFLDVPTDCPQRDERMGWTGDAQVFSGTACFNRDSAAFYTKYMYDMLMEQEKANGAVPDVVPRFECCGYSACAWADAAAVIPWNLYLFYGDKGLLREQYPNMKKWVDWLIRNDEENGMGRLWSNGFHYADWLALDTKARGNSDAARFGGTDKYYIASAYYFYSASLLAKAAKALGYAEDAEKYGRVADEVKSAIQKEFFTASGRIAPATQTAYICALFMGFAPEEHREKLIRLLGEEFEASEGELRTGFVGTAYLNRTLTGVGYNELAYHLMLNEEYPGWLYEVNMGATTVWERWNSVNPDGTMSDTGMNSLNHYAYGAVLEWIYRDVAGINPVEDAPGFRKALIRPNPSRQLSEIVCRYDSASGAYESSWKIEGDLFKWHVEVPFGCEAKLVFPAGERADDEITVGPGEYDFAYPLAEADAPECLKSVIWP